MLIVRTYFFDESFCLIVPLSLNRRLHNSLFVYSAYWRSPIIIPWLIYSMFWPFAVYTIKHATASISALLFVFTCFILFEVLSNQITTISIFASHFWLAILILFDIVPYSTISVHMRLIFTSDLRLPVCVIFYIFTNYLVIVFDYTLLLDNAVRIILNHFITHPHL